LAPEARAAFIKDGKRFGSEDTLEQANQTFNAYLTHGSKLVAFGFAPEEAAELKDTREALIEAGVGREAKRTSKKIDTVAARRPCETGRGYGCARARCSQERNVRSCFRGIPKP
jgi:hypothetical protein